MALKASSREEIKKLKTDAAGQEQLKEENKKARVRLIPLWQKAVIIVVLLCVSFVIGAAIGYGVIGDGKALDTFKISTWKHIFDLVDKK